MGLEDRAFLHQDLGDVLLGLDAQGHGQGAELEVGVHEEDALLREVLELGRAVGGEKARPRPAAGGEEGEGPASVEHDGFRCRGGLRGGLGHLHRLAAALEEAAHDHGGEVLVHRHEPVEVRLHDLEETRVHGDVGVGHARRVAQDAHLAEEVAVLERNDLLDAAPVVGDADVHLPHDDDVEGVRRIAGPEEGGACLDRVDLADLLQLDQIPLLQGGEEGNVADDVAGFHGLTLLCELLPLCHAARSPVQHATFSLAGT